MRRYAGIAGAAIVVVVAGGLIGARRCGGGDPPAAPQSAAHTPRDAARTAVGTAVGDDAPRASTDRVRRMPPEDRARLRQELATALERRARERAASAPSTGAPGEAPPLVLRVEDVGAEAQAALQASIPLLAECYPTGAGSARDAVAMLVMTSDPELGMVIDMDRITDISGAPLDATIETCMRDTIDALALPALPVPGTLPLQYSFRFD